MTTSYKKAMGGRHIWSSCIASNLTNAEGLPGRPLASTAAVTVLSVARRGSGPDALQLARSAAHVLPALPAGRKPCIHTAASIRCTYCRGMHACCPFPAIRLSPAMHKAALRKSNTLLGHW